MAKYSTGGLSIGSLRVKGNAVFGDSSGSFVGFYDISGATQKSSVSDQIDSTAATAAAVAIKNLYTVLKAYGLMAVT